MLRYLTIALLLAHPHLFQEATVTLQGGWTASSGTRTFRGTWSAEVQSKTPDTAQGSWTLLDAGNRIIMKGTWAAQKSARGWSGTWSARVVTQTPKGSSAGNPISGSWRADMDPDRRGTLLEMLQRTMENSASGTWRSGPYSGKWALSGSRQ
jgi:hypothetical protein